jgi:hypothetical protein
MLGSKGAGGLFVWVMIVLGIFMYSLLYIALDNVMQNTLPGVAESINATTATSIMTDTILPIWRLSPWGITISLILYGIFSPILSTPEGRVY